jgi:hypothetical protein
MRNTNVSIELRRIQFSDYAVDMRKLNTSNDLCQSSILATGGGACVRSSEPRCDQCEESQPREWDEEES